MVGGGAHPGARASRAHAIPLRAAQFPCDAAPGHHVGGNATGSAQAESWRRCRSTRVEVHRSLCLFVARLQQRLAVSSSIDLPGRPRAALALPETNAVSQEAMLDCPRSNHLPTCVDHVYMMLL